MISGRLRVTSTNTVLLRTPETVGPPSTALSPSRGMSHLPQFNPEVDVPPRNPAVETLRAADAVLFSTPEDAGDLPGSFENLLDRADGDDQRASPYEKPVAWINRSPRGGADELTALRRVLGYLGATLVGEACIRVPITRDPIGSDGPIDSNALRRPLADFVIRLGVAIRTGRIPPIRRSRVPRLTQSLPDVDKVMTYVVHCVDHHPARRSSGGLGVVLHDATLPADVSRLPRRSAMAGGDPRRALDSAGAPTPIRRSVRPTCLRSAC